MAAAITRFRALIGDSRRRLFLTGNIWRAASGRDSNPIFSFASSWRAVHVPHTEAYEKNPDESVRQVADEVLQPPDSDTYWAPHPKTGVFGPVGHTATPTLPSPPATGAGEGHSSALDQTLWFRPPEADEAPRQDPS